MARNIIEVPFARSENQRQRALFAWADSVLHELGLIERIARAADLNELRKIIFDPDVADVMLAIRDALHPTIGAKVWFLEGLREGAVKRVLKLRFNDIKAEREAELRRGGGPHPAPASDWTDDLKFDDKTGAIRRILSNYILFLVHHPSWVGVLAYDEFNARVVIRKRPPWGEVKPGTFFTDHHETQTRVWFQCELDISPSLGDTGRAVQAAARGNSFHPVRDYLDSLEWDGTPRLDNWLITYFHAEDSDYIRVIGPRWLISAVARIYQPGCQVDHALVLEGPQGQGKSKALRILASKDWFNDRMSHISSKDAAQEIAGVWVIEVAEMDALNRVAASTTKSFLTRLFDKFRPPYGHHQIRQQRQCVFAGTINPSPGGYLKDPTGARRFWPAACPGMIDCAGLERDRDQLWAEAVYRYNAGQKWWLETPELEALATAEQELRFKSSIWKTPIKEWLGKRKDVSLSEVLRGALGIEPRHQSHSAEIQVAKILTSLGFTRYRPRKRKGTRSRKGDDRQRRYRRQ